MANKELDPIVQAFIYETEGMLEQMEQILLKCEETKEFDVEDIEMALEKISFASEENFEEASYGEENYDDDEDYDNEDLDDDFEMSFIDLDD